MAKKNEFNVCIIEKEESFLHEIMEMAFIILIAFSIAVIFGTYVTMSRSVAGVSMRPTYNNAAEYTDYNKTYDTVRITRIGAIGRGDIIVFTAPKMNNRLLIKRVIAKGGDSLEFRESEEYADTAEVWLKTAGSTEFRRLDEPYINKDGSGKPLFTISERWLYGFGQQISVPKGSYFVMGDNRDKSTDSRFSEVGFVPAKDIDGRVYLYVPYGDTFISALWREVFS